MQEKIVNYYFSPYKNSLYRKGEPVCSNIDQLGKQFKQCCKCVIFLEPQNPDFTDVPVSTSDASIQIDAAVTSIKTASGRIDRYVFDNSSSALGIPNAVSLSTNESFNLSSLYPGTEYGLSFYGLINGCGGVMSQESAQITVCTG